MYRLFRSNIIDFTTTDFAHTPRFTNVSPGYADPKVIKMVIKIEPKKFVCIYIYNHIVFVVSFGNAVRLFFFFSYASS